MKGRTGNAQRPSAAGTLGPADWLGLAATPSFALMAILTTATGDGMAGILCSAAPGASLIGGMTPMYVLMSAFHATHWAKLFSRA